jgi:protein-tyrosine phosphatase
MDTHRTRELERELVEWADLVIGLSTEHARDVVRDFPDARHKTFTLKGLLSVLPASGPYHDEWTLGLAASLDEAGHPADNDVEDPFGERVEAYRRVATEVRELVERMAEGLEAVIGAPRP